MMAPPPEFLAALELLIAAAPKDRPPVILVSGCQGSGKTTLCRGAAQAWDGVQVSLDDVYLSRAERAVMARDVHPLFQTRGPPGTHDLPRLGGLIDVLRSAGPKDETPLPGFDKRADDRTADAQCPRFRGRPSVILIDGWCLGATPQNASALVPPVNALERDRDPDGSWRAEINRRVGGDYARFAEGADGLLFLQAPAFDTVLDWRCEQEAGLLGVAPVDLADAERKRLETFVAHFERLTRWMLAGGVRANATLKLDRNRQVLDCSDDDPGPPP